MSSSNTKTIALAIRPRGMLLPMQSPMGWLGTNHHPTSPSINRNKNTDHIYIYIYIGKPIPTLPSTTTINLDDSTGELYKQLSRTTGLSISRLRISKGSDGSLIPNDKTRVESTRLRDQSIIYVKDLGPQIGWRTVFVIEYLGPLIIHPVMYFVFFQQRRRHGDDDHKKDFSDSPTTTTTITTTTQTISLILITLHFLKRELETIFVHRFSSSTMPAFNIFKNSFHYWILAGLNMAYFTYNTPPPPPPPPHPTATTTTPIVIYGAIILFVISELLNLSTHLHLRSLRPQGSTARAIPRGWGFDLITCPNYLYEMLAWMAVWIVNWRLSFWSTGLFLVVATVQMALWARKKEGRYRREFGGQYRRKRWVMIPGVI